MPDFEELFLTDETCSCPTCGGEANILGDLGPLTWARCRDCGATFNL